MGNHHIYRNGVEAESSSELARTPCSVFMVIDVPCNAVCRWKELGGGGSKSGCWGAPHSLQ